MMHALNQHLMDKAAEQSKALEEAVSGFKSSVLDAITPGRKRKERYDNFNIPPTSFYTSGKFDSGDSVDSNDGDLVILPSEDSQDQTPEGKTATILGQWDSVVSSINKLSAVIKWLCSATGTDLQKLESMLLRVDAGL